ncbi:MAG TPA: ligase-associated DNA damage response endonuclease PdeM [Flavobacteriales bacterium]|nr:ligase-associated DNA damage response endonuclease PdeM [Flavobacteriales bacterium]
MLPAEMDIAGERLLLHPHRAIYWERMHWLIVSDLHLGKAAHFRKAGMALPEGHDGTTLARLDALLQVFTPERLLILGDLFHSDHNNNWDLFTRWASNKHSHLHLVKGNHDILADQRYADAGLQVCHDTLEEGPFVFTHDPVERPGCYVIGGHIHPGVVLSGQGRQHLRLPCFAFGPHIGLLPAFGTSTGTFNIQPDATHRIYATTDRAVLDVSAAFAGRQSSKSRS